MTCWGTPSIEGCILIVCSCSKPSYLSYMTQVDRALKGFESTAEWADLIAALTKLNRVNIIYSFIM